MRRHRDRAAASPTRKVAAAMWLVAVTSTVSASVAGGSQPLDAPHTVTVAGASPVGALFPQGLEEDHTCTAGVVASAPGNLVVTAAHCIDGTAAGWVFAPGYAKGPSSSGTWTVTAAFVDPRWMSGHDPRYDMAVLRIANRESSAGSETIEQVTGGDQLGAGPVEGESVGIIAYNTEEDTPRTCASRLHLTTDHGRTYSAISCDGFVAGSSGSPWVTRTASGRGDIVGVLGGLYQGGCTADTSYASTVGPWAQELLSRASDAHRAGDDVPAPPGSGC